MILRTVLIYQFFLKSFTRFTLLIFALEGKKKKKKTWQVLLWILLCQDDPCNQKSLWLHETMMKMWPLSSLVPPNAYLNCFHFLCYWAVLIVLMVEEILIIELTLWQEYPFQQPLEQCWSQCSCPVTKTPTLFSITSTIFPIDMPSASSKS